MLTRKPKKGEKIRCLHSGEIYEVLGDATFGTHILSLKRSDGASDCVIWKSSHGLNKLHVIIEDEAA